MRVGGIWEDMGGDEQKYRKEGVRPPWNGAQESGQRGAGEIILSNVESIDRCPTQCILLSANKKQEMKGVERDQDDYVSL